MFELNPFLLSQLLALGTLIAGLAAFQCRERTSILRGWCIAASFGAAHFWFLGAIEASALVGVTALRFLVSSFTTDRRVMYLFLALVVAGFAATYQSPVSLLALGATLIGTVGSFSRTDRSVRLAMMTTEVIWLVHNVIVWSPVAIGMEFLFLSSNIIGLLRHRRRTPPALQ